METIDTSAGTKMFIGSRMHQFPWAKYDEYAPLQHFFAGLTNSSRAYITNSNHTIGLFDMEGAPMPFSVSERYQKGDSYLLSLVSQFCDYAREEVLESTAYSQKDKAVATWLMPIFKKLALGLGMEKTVFINNFLLSTNHYPELNRAQLAEGLAQFQRSFPRHSICFRGLNDGTDYHLLSRLKALGGLPIVCRKVYILDTRNARYRKKRPFQNDCKLWKGSSALYWEAATMLNGQQAAAALSQYRALYLQKYSQLNPAYTPHFVQAAAQSGLLKFLLLKRRDTDALLGVMAINHRYGKVCTPFIGYDRSVPQKIGLYRLMNVKLTEYAAEHQAVFNMSSGAGKFKKVRGGIPHYEYHVFFVRHLPKAQQWAWDKLYWLSESFTKPSMAAYDL